MNSFVSMYVTVLVHGRSTNLPIVKFEFKIIVDFMMPNILDNLLKRVKLTEKRLDLFRPVSFLKIVSYPCTDATGGLQEAIY